MRKKIFSLLFLLGMTNNFIDVQASEPLVVLTARERKNLKFFFGNSLYKSESYLESLDIVSRDYLIDLISRHITILENKILQNKSGWQSWGVFKGLGWLAGTFIGGYVAYSQYQTLFTGSFGRIIIPDSQMNCLSSMRFSRAERKKLDLLFETMKINDSELRPVFSWNGYFKLNYLSEKDINKLHYLMLRLACQKTQQNIVVGLGMFGLCFGISIYQFYKVTRYAERLVERLERDKRVLGLLQDQQDKQLGKTE